MKIDRVVRKMRSGARYLQLRARGIEWIFVLGHMRAGSSLLVHLLNSNREILGYGETHRIYHNRRSLAKLHDHLYEQFETHGEEVGDYRYVMDKILHHRIYDSSVLRVQPLKVFVIVRDPRDALPSILSRDLEAIQTPNDALGYYTRTLERIDKELGIYGRPFVLVEYQKLVDSSESILRKASDYLELSEQLSPEYDVMWSTGEKGMGDDSPSISKGQILGNTVNYDLNVPSRIIDHARERYQSFVSKHRTALLSSQHKGADQPRVRSTNNGNY